MPTMEECMRACMIKLALWYTKTFKPIMTHDELEPIMATLGFVGQPNKPGPNGVLWKEYVYTAGHCRSYGFQRVEELPTPKLPYQRIDGLHIYTFRAFIDALNFYLEMDDISELFHIRGMPLHRVYDKNKRFRRMEDDESVFVYREGTLDQATYNIYHVDTTTTTNNDICNNNKHNALVIRDKGSNDSMGVIVPLKDIIV